MCASTTTRALARCAQNQGRVGRPGGSSVQTFLGEITTVLVAVARDIDLAVIDDRTGKALAKARGLPTISTAMLAVEMTVLGALTPQQGFAVYDLATPDGVGSPEFTDATRRVTDALGE